MAIKRKVKPVAQRSAVTEKMRQQLGPDLSAWLEAGAVLPSPEEVMEHFDSGALLMRDAGFMLCMQRAFCNNLCGYYRKIGKLE
jgi:hypothetical protein